MGEMLLAVKVVNKEGKEVRDEALISALLKARDAMCDIANDRGGVKAFNDVADLWELDPQSDEYVDAYEAISNACWTQQLKKLGFQERVLQERIVPVSGLLGLWRINRATHVLKITIE